MLNICETKQHKSICTVLVGVVVCLFVVLIISGIMGIVNKAKYGDNRTYRDAITIQGQGKVYVKPDLAIVDLSVVTNGSNVNDVQDKNTNKMNKVLDFLKGFGVEEKDIKTINYNIYPQYVYGEGVVPRIVGYEISQTLEVKVRKLDKVGEILEKSVAAGVNQVNSLRFWVDKDEDFKAEARKLAINDAKKKAGKLASDLKIRFGKLVGYSDEGSYYPVPMYAKEMGGIGGGGGAVPDIQTGENEIIVNVSLTYEIK